MDPAADVRTVENAGRGAVSLRGSIGGTIRAPRGTFPQRRGSSWPNELIFSDKE